MIKTTQNSYIFYLHLQTLSSIYTVVLKLLLVSLQKYKKDIILGFQREELIIRCVLITSLRFRFGLGKYTLPNPISSYGHEQFIYQF